ncbi:MAG: radical SAM family heme chaperone HemW [bacterium]
MYNNNDLSLYLHIPFCKEKCFYCDFLSFKGREAFFEDYKRALILEIEHYARELHYNALNVKTIFIGGGTPSVMPVGYISDILEALYSNFNVCENAEISIEANPGTLSYNKIKNFKDFGINRISLGLQAYNNNLLKRIGRIHNIRDFVENYNNIRKVGINNINVDLMFSLPNQTLTDFKHTLKNIIELNPEHISTYSLILEEDTKFFDMYNNDEFELATDELDREYYYMAKDMLSKSNYNLYEISNFAKPNKECKHNLVYWERKQYLGLGLGASSYLVDYSNSTIVRRQNITDLEDYIFNVTHDNFINNYTQEFLSIEHLYSEFIFLGLRVTKGVSKQAFYDEFGINIESIYNEQIQKFIEYGLLEEYNNYDRIRLTPKGVDLSNTVFTEFL